MAAGLVYSPVVGAQVNDDPGGGVNVRIVPLGILASVTDVLTVDEEPVEELGGVNGVTLKKFPTAPEIPILADGEDNVALLGPYTNWIWPVAS